MCIISFCMNIQNGHDLLSEKYLKSIWCHKWASAVGVFLIEWMFASQDSVYPSVWFRWFCLEDISISYIVHVCTWRECFKIKSPMPRIFQQEMSAVYLSYVWTWILLVNTSFIFIFFILGMQQMTCV